MSSKLLHWLQQSKNRTFHRAPPKKEQIPTPESAHSGEKAVQREPNGYASPDYDASGTRPSIIKDLCMVSTPRRRYKIADQNSGREQKKSRSPSHNPYLTPGSPDSSVARAQQRRKPKAMIRQKRSPDADSAYCGLTEVSQPIFSAVRIFTESEPPNIGY